MSAARLVLVLPTLFLLLFIQATAGHNFKRLSEVCSWRKYARKCKDAGYQPAFIDLERDKEALITLLNSTPRKRFWVAGKSVGGDTKGREMVSMVSSPVAVQLTTVDGEPVVEFAIVTSEKEVPLCAKKHSRHHAQGGVMTIDLTGNTPRTKGTVKSGGKDRRRKDESSSDSAKRPQASPLKPKGLVMIDLWAPDQLGSTSSGTTTTTTTTSRSPPDSSSATTTGSKGGLRMIDLYNGVKGLHMIDLYSGDKGASGKGTVDNDLVEQDKSTQEPSSDDKPGSAGEGDAGSSVIIDNDSGSSVIIDNDSGSSVITGNNAGSSVVTVNDSGSSVTTGNDAGEDSANRHGVADGRAEDIPESTGFSGVFQKVKDAVVETVDKIKNKLSSSSDDDDDENSSSSSDSDSGKGDKTSSSSSESDSGKGDKKSSPRGKEKEESASGDEKPLDDSRATKNDDPKADSPSGFPDSFPFSYSPFKITKQESRRINTEGTEGGLKDDMKRSDPPLSTVPSHRPTNPRKKINLFENMPSDSKYAPNDDVKRFNLPPSTVPKGQPNEPFNTFSMYTFGNPKGESTTTTTTTTQQKSSNLRYLDKSLAEPPVFSGRAKDAGSPSVDDDVLKSIQGGSWTSVNNEVVESDKLDKSSGDPSSSDPNSDSPKGSPKDLHSTHFRQSSSVRVPADHHLGESSRDVNGNPDTNENESEIVRKIHPTSEEVRKDDQKEGSSDDRKDGWSEDSVNSSSEDDHDDNETTLTGKNPRGDDEKSDESDEDDGQPDRSHSMRILDPKRKKTYPGDDDHLGVGTVESGAEITKNSPERKPGFFTSIVNKVKSTFDSPGDEEDKKSGQGDKKTKKRED